MMEEMIEAPNEEARLAALDELEILGTPAEQAYDDITELAAFICGTPVSLVSLVGRNTQFFKSARNVAIRETPREQSFCAHTLLTAQTLVVEDASKDERFASNPLVTGDPCIRFYAGAPIIGVEGHVYGTVCVIDSKPHHLSDHQLAALERLARQASNLLNRQALSLKTTRLEAEAITGREESEREREQLQLSLDAADIAAWFYDPNRNVVGGDVRMSKLFGMSAAEAPAEVWIEAIYAADRTSVGKEFAASLAGAPYDTKFRVVVDGEIHWLHSRAKTTTQPDGSVRMIGVCEDITREETLASELHLERERLQTSLVMTNATSFDWVPETDVVRWGGVPPFGVDPAEIPSGASLWNMCRWKIARASRTL